MINLLRKRLKHPKHQPLQIHIVLGGRRTGTTLLSAILSSDHRANLFGQEAQILTRIIETYSWGRRNFEHFGTSFFPDLESYRTFFQETIVQFCSKVASHISPGGILILKHPALSKVLIDAMDLLPNANFIATVRDPRDQVSSELEVGARRMKVGIRDPNSETRNVVALAKQFMAFNKEILEVHNQQLKRLYIVRYENLVQKPQDVISDLQRALALNLTFDPSRPWPRMSKHGARSLTAHPSRSDLYGAPIDMRSIGRYENDLSVAETRKIEHLCHTLMHEFGYLIKEIEE